MLMLMRAGFLPYGNLELVWTVVGTPSVLARSQDGGLGGPELARGGGAGRRWLSAPRGRETAAVGRRICRKP